MAPKKAKGASAPSTSKLPPQPPAADGGGGGGGVQNPRRSGDPSHQNDVVRGGTSQELAVVVAKDGAATSKGVAVTSRDGAATSRPSRDGRDTRRCDAGGSRHHRDKTPEHRSQGAHGPPPRQPAGENRPRQRERDGAPSGSVRSRGTSRSSRPVMPNTPAEAMAQAQLLLNFPPARGQDGRVEGYHPEPPQLRRHWRSAIGGNFMATTHAAGKTSWRAYWRRCGNSAVSSSSAAADPAEPTRWTRSPWRRLIRGAIKINAKYCGTGKLKTPAQL